MCDEYKDLLPLIDSGELTEQEDFSLREHLRSCAACRGEAALFSRLPAIIGQPRQDGWAADVVSSVRTTHAARADKADVVPTGSTEAARTSSMARGSYAPAPQLRRAVVSIVGAALLALLFVGMSMMLQARQQTPGGGASPTSFAPTIGNATPDGTAVGMSTQQAAYDAMLATSVARATASPYPDAEQVQIQTGKPASAIVRRGGLTLELRLSKDSYLAGEAGRAEVTVRNDGSETLFGRDLSIGLVDRWGQTTDWPLMPLKQNKQGGPARGNQRYEIAPGESISRTFAFQVPALDVEGTEKQAALPISNLYSLWVATRFSLGMPESGYRGPDSVVLNLEAGPLPLVISEPQAEQILQAHLSADANGYQLSVVDAEGKAPAGISWGDVQTTWQNGTMGSRLEDSEMGTWSETWLNSSVGNGGQLTVWAWVAAEGYVTAVVTETVSTDPPGDGTRVTAGEPSGFQHETFGSLDAARNYLAPLGITMSAPRYLPEGFILEHVQVDQVNYEGGNWSEVHQVYKLTDTRGNEGNGGSIGASSAYGEASLQLAQMNSFGNSMGDFGPENPEYRAAAQRLMVGEQEIYATQRFSLWTLVWKIGDTVFEMSAPVSAMPLEKLLETAGSVAPSP